MNGQLNKNVKAISGNSSIRAKFWKTKPFFLKKILTRAIRFLPNLALPLSPKHLKSGFGSNLARV
jgi:hypothetical protein